MSKIHYIPEGYHTVTPYFVVADGPAFLGFLQRVFDAQERSVFKDPAGRIMHAELHLGDSVVEFGEANSQWPPMRLNLHVYVPDTDATYRRAMEAGAKSLRDPRDEFYGERSAGIEDPAGNIWWLATRIEDVAPEEMERRAAPLQSGH
jgi:PhnB protein